MLPQSCGGDLRELKSTPRPQQSLLRWGQGKCCHATTIANESPTVLGRLQRFLTIGVQSVNRPLYFPLGHMDDEDRSLVETLRLAFFNARSVELVWRDSLFFNQIEFMFDSDNKIPILVEVHVRA